ncbi:MAG: SDR family NAD(P)-dependent oxidoreductase [Pseudomonadota bacterium]
MRKTRKPTPPGIAITGYSCRLPGAADPTAFWDLLMSGRCAVGPIPQSRWDAERFYHPGKLLPGTSYSNSAGLVEDVWGFDPGFFGISPREAEQMDPQQRVMLEVVWEAIEHAYLTSDDLPKLRCGVFLGAASLDHSLVSISEPATMGPNFMTGNTLSILSNRLSYVFDLKGPSYTVDTACSSSFYALHQAAEALRKGEIDAAIVGGINLVLSPFHFVGFSRAAMLSPDGLCKAFDASANGYVRGEGAVAFVLRRGDALAGHEPVRAELLGTGVNSDGRTIGLSMPSETDQARLLDKVYQALDVNPDHVAFMEAHGTGTHVGDPIEARAIGTVLGQRRSQPLTIGSAKTNVGHLEAASGLVGLLKAQLALEHGRVPPSLHFNEPNPEIDFDGLNLRVAVEPVSFEAQPEDTPWIAGVNSFGFGGANAHAVLRQAPPQPEPQVTPAAPMPPLILSAASKSSLAALATRWRERLDGVPGVEAAALISANARLRTRHTHRAVLTGQADLLPDQLDALANDTKHPGCLTGEAPDRGGKTAFVFCGNGAQWVGMGLDLYETDTAYRESFDRVSKAFRRLSGLDLTALMRAEDLSEQLDHGLVGQPLLLALQIALVEALAAKGLRPDAVAGHSVGEVAAAWTAGCLSLSDACRLIHARASAMEELRGTGAMAAVLAGADAAENALADMGLTGLDIAGDNSPRSSTISGPADLVEAFIAGSKSRRLAARQIPVTYPYHGPALEQVREALLAGLKGIKPKKGRIPVFSSTTGGEIAGTELGATYWWQNARQRVRFREAVEGLAHFGVTSFVEIGPRPQLQAYVTDTARGIGRKVAVTPSLDNSAKSPRDAVAIVARALAHGAQVDEAAFFGPERGPVASLPAYPWSHTQFRAPVTSNGIDILGERPSHPLLGWQLRPGEGVWRCEIDAIKRPWLADHVVDGAVVLPGAAFVEIALAAGAETHGSTEIELRDFDILAPLMLEDNAAQSTTLRTRLEFETGILRIESRPYLSEQDWTLHARGTVGRARAPGAGVPAHPGLALLPEWPGERLYALLDAAGLSYGPAFRRVTRLRAGGGWAEADLSAPEGAERFQVHPAVLDGAFHAIFPLIAAELADAGLSASIENGDTFVPVRFGHVTSLAPGQVPARADLHLVRLNDHGAEIALTLRDSDGRSMVRLEGLRLQKIRLKAQRHSGPSLWHQRMLPMAENDMPAALAAEWAESQKRLADLGLTAVDAPEPDAGSLIVDAAFRRVAWDALSMLAGDEGRLSAHPDGLAESALPLYHRLRHALEEDDVIVPVEEEAALLDCPYPRLDELLDALISEAPQRSGDVMSLMRCATVLPNALAEGLGDGHGARPARYAPAQRRLWQAVGAAIEDFVACHPGEQALEVMLLGDAPVDLLDHLCALPGLTRLTLSDPEDHRVEILRLTAPQHPVLRVVNWEDALQTNVDLVASGDALGRLGRARVALLDDMLRPGGVVVAAERIPDLGVDLTHGLDADWWAETLMPETPLSQLDGAESWMAALTGAGFDGVAAAPLDVGDVAATMLTARKVERRASIEEPGPRKFLMIDAGEILEQALIGSGHQAAHVTEEDLPKLLSAEDPADLVLCLVPRADFTEQVMQLQRIVALAPLPGRLWLLASGADRAQTARIRGVMRVVANEHPGLDLRLADLDEGADPSSLAAILANPGEEREWHLSHAGMSVPRVEALPDPQPRQLAECDALSLGMRRDGALDTLEWQPAQRRAPEADEIEISVAATGLNFRDVMWAQRLLPAEALEDGFAGATLGMECSGIVTRAGASSEFEPGDRVIAFAPQSFASHATLPAIAAARMPDGLEVETGAALPTIFLTAHYSLVELAQVQPGETVLIHGGAGGVGLAALQIAKARRARVFATAGSPQKRRLLELLGAESVFDSRSLAFAEEIRAATDGEGVDVVLNSLAGEAMTRSLELVRPFGRFIELGKQDYYTNTRLGLRPFRRNVSYFGVDADQLVSVRPDLAERMFTDLTQRFADGTYTAPPIQVFAPGEVVDAFRLMQKSDHIGKVVICAPQVAERQVVAPKPLGDGAWLITGGLGGLGLAVAEWLVDQGVETLWLQSRSGKAKPGMEDRLAALAQRVEVEQVAVDVTDPAGMSKLIDRIEASDVPLEGIVHGAMVLDDALFADMDAETLERVIAPKIRGAELLDTLTRPLTPDHFVMFSSVAALFGNPGQAAYAAANAGLEHLAATRRAEGLPGLAIGWGPIRDQGYLAREEDLRDRLERQLKGAMLDTSQVLKAFGALIADPAAGPAVTYAPMRWGHLVEDLATVASPLFERVDRTVQRGPASAQDFLDEISGLEDGAARERIIAALITETARILRQPESEIDPYRPMTELGFDSLMAVDLKLSAEEELGISLPLMSLGEQLTIADLAIKVLARIRSGDAAGDDAVDDLMVRHVGVDLDQVDKDFVEDAIGKAGKSGQRGT